MTKIYAFIRHNSCQILTVIVSVIVILFAYSCQSTVVSITNPPVRVTRGEFVIEVESFLANAELKFGDLDRQDLVKETIFDSVLDLVSGGDINPIGVATAILGILGLGAIGDNIRKRTHINTLKGNLLNGKVHERVKEIIKPSEN